MENSDILKILYDSRNEFVSGEQISTSLNISRAALSKRIKKLRENGMEIEAVTNKGYCLKSIGDDITEDNCKLEVSDKQVIGCEIETLTEVDSTNDYAKKSALKSKEGKVIVSRIQTKGKGRRGRTFDSQSGGLYFTIILKPKIGINKVPFITQLTACSVFCALEDFGIKSEIKWPNDIIINDKKVCGILCELSCEMDFVNYVVAGIGINVNETKFDKEVEKVATSIEKEGYKVSRIELFWKILKYYDYFYQQFLSGKYDEIINVLKENSYIIGRDINIITASETIEAKAIDLDEDGFLVVEYKDGKKDKLNYGEISVRKR